jgi:hypothetical protein
MARAVAGGVSNKKPAAQTAGFKFSEINGE